MEPHADWPALAFLVRWLERYGGVSPWSTQWVPDRAGPAGMAVDRAGILEAVERMGEERVRQILRHPLARGLYRNGLYYLQAVLGWNAAEVEADFLKRSKRAVNALGMLPLEEDLLERYLALQRFVREARKAGGTKRQASEQTAAAAGIANLAVNAGYGDAGPLEWAMEARLGSEAASSERIWTLGGCAGGGGGRGPHGGGEGRPAPQVGAAYRPPIPGVCGDPGAA